MWSWFNKFAEPCGVAVLTTDDDVTRDVTCDFFHLCLYEDCIDNLLSDEIENWFLDRIIDSYYQVLWVLYEFFHAESASTVQKDLSYINLIKSKTGQLTVPTASLQILIKLFTLDKLLYFIFCMTVDHQTLMACNESKNLKF